MPWRPFRRLWPGVRHFECDARWEQAAPADWRERILDIPVTDRFHAKQGRSIARWTLGDSWLVVYLKRHYRLSRRLGLLALLCPWRPWSPGRQEWEHLQWASAQGLPVPAPMAVGEWVGPFGRLQSFIAVEELVGMLPLHEAIPAAAARLTVAAFERWKRGLVAEMVRLARALHDHRRFHKDFYLCHFYVSEADTRTVPDWRGRVFLIDFHRLGHHRLGSRWWQAKDLGQLLFSSDVAGVNARDRLRFWRGYNVAERGTWTRAWLRRVILLRYRAYARRSRRRHERRLPRAA